MEGSNNDQINYSPPNICSVFTWKEEQLFSVSWHPKLKKFHLNVQGRSGFFQMGNCHFLDA